MKYRFSLTLVLLLNWLLAASCEQPAKKGVASTCGTGATGDTVYTLSLANPSFRQTVNEKTLPQKKIIRITVAGIKNPAAVAISFDLYWNTGGEKQMIGSVAPFPADNPGSFIVAINNKITGKGELELRLSYPADWNKKDSLEVKIKPLTLE